jgi:hypothetical protein
MRLPRQVRLHHHDHEFLEGNSRLPLQARPRFGWVGDEQAHFGGKEKETEDSSSVSLTIYAIPSTGIHCAFY